jgi:alpha-glucosidase
VRTTSTHPVQTFNSLDIVDNVEGRLTLSGRRHRIELSVIAPDLFRFRATSKAAFSVTPSWAVIPSDRPAMESQIHRTRYCLRLISAAGALQVNLRNGELQLFGGDESPCLRSEPRQSGFCGSQPRCAFRLFTDELFLGMGESSGPFNRAGLVQEFWNTDALGHGGIHPGLRNLYTAIPFAIMMRGGRATGLFWDNPARQRWDLGQADRGLWQLQAASGELDLYLFTGPGVADVMRCYARLTGSMPMPPRWALGYHQCRYSYESRADVEQVAREIRRRRIPCDALYLDIHHMNGFRVFTFGKSFPRPADMIARLRRRGFQTVAIVDPGVKVDPGFGVYRRGQRLGAYVRMREGRRNYVGRVWPGRSERVGVAGFWNDMNEPANFIPPAKTLPATCRHQSESGPVTHAEAHNVYGMQMARASREGALRTRPRQRPFVITRAAYAGTQRHAMIWTGDNASSWEQLADSVQMLLNLGLSGFPFCGGDAGGFLENCTPELYARWMQMAAFTPFFRNHTMVGTLAHEPWSFGPEIEAIVRGAIELRYQLLPYWYGLFAEAHRSGAPIMRPLVWHYQDDPVATACGDQFLLGPSLLVAPVLRQGAVARSVYLPGGVWFDFWSGRRHRGGRHLVADAPLHRLPIFVRGGAVVPKCSLRQHTGGFPDRTIALHLWPGKRSELAWYEDDGCSLQHAQGAYHLRRIGWDGRSLTFGPGEGEFVSQVKSWRILVHHLARPLKGDSSWRNVRFDALARIGSFQVPNRRRPSRIRLA